MEKLLNIDELTCGVCFDYYNELEKKPRSLSCGHAICTSCITKILASKADLMCPFCRNLHMPIPTDGCDLAINYPLLSMAQKMAAMGIEGQDASLLHATVSHLSAPHNKASETASKSQQKEASMMWLPPSSTASSMEASLHPELHADKCEVHGDYQDSYCLTCQNFICNQCKIIDHQDINGCRVTSFTKGIEVLKKRDQTIWKQLLAKCADNLMCLNKSKAWLQDMKVKQEMEATKKSNEFLSQILALEEELRTLREKLCHHEESHKNKVLQLVLDNKLIQVRLAEGEEMKNKLECLMDRLSGATNLQELTMIRLEGSGCCLSVNKWNTSVQCDQLAKYPVFRKKASEYEMRKLLESHTVIPLEDKLNQLRKLLEEAEADSSVWTELQEESESPRHAKLSLQEGQVLLHALQDAPPPDDAIVLPYGRVRALVGNEATPTTFLALSWPESCGGMVTILTKDNLRGKQFVALCTGRTGPSYAHSRLLGVYDKGRAGEFLRGGDYDGKGGTEVVPGAGLEWDETGQKCVAGLVCGGRKGKQYSAQFCIVTRDDISYCVALGHVVTGLQTLRDVVKLDDVTTVTLHTCGIVLTQ